MPFEDEFARTGPVVGHLPVALATVTVAGQCRERSPIDVSLFGPDGDRFVDRFVARSEGQALLSRGISDGAAEAAALLVTPSGARPFRVTLWRQRGGERIRLLAAFCADELPPPKAIPALARDGGFRATVQRIGHDLRTPLSVLLRLAGRLRDGAGQAAPEEIASCASDIAAASWRLVSLADDLALAGAVGDAVPLGRAAEVDLARISRRIARLARPLAESVGAVIETVGLKEGAVVVADESSLWGVIDDLLQGAVRSAGQGGAAHVALFEADGGVALRIGAEAGSDEAERPESAGPISAAAVVSRGAEQIARVLAESGARLEFAAPRRGGMEARVVFPASRCLPFA